MALTKDDLKAISDLIQPIRDDLQGVKDDLQGVKEDVQGLKEDMQEVKGDVQGLKEDMQEVKGDVQGLKEDMQEVKGELAAVKLHLENVTDKNIQLLAENHIALVEKLNQAIPVADANRAYEVKVNYAIQEIYKLKTEVAKLQASKTA